MIYAEDHLDWQTAQMGLIKRLFGGGSPQPAPPSPAPGRAQDKPPSVTEPNRQLDGQDRWYVPADGNSDRFRGADGQPALHLIEYQSGLRLCEDATGLLIGPTDRRLVGIGIYVSNLRGTTYHEKACVAGDFSPGASVRLVPEPDNPYDDRAVAVYDITGKYLAAYVNKMKARAILKQLATGIALEAISIRGTGPGQACPQIAILASEPRVIAHLRSPRPRSLPRPAHL